MNNNNKNTEIDLLDIFHTLLSKLPFLLIVTLVFGAAAWAYTTYRIPKLYKASVSMYASTTNRIENDSSSSSAITYSEQNANYRLTETASVILKSNTVMQEASRRLAEDNISYNYGQLRSMTSVSTTGTEVFYITITGTKPEDLKQVADTVADVAVKKIPDITRGGYATVIDYAVTPVAPSSPNVKRNTILGALIGLVLSAAIVIIRSMLDTKIWNEEDLTKQYDIPVLGTIPKLSQPEKSSGGKE